MSSGTGGNGTAYPNGAVNANGVSLYGQRCTRVDRWTPRTCYYYLVVNPSNIHDGDTYYQLLNGTMQSYTVTATGYQVDSFFSNGDNVAGYFKKVFQLDL